MKLKHGVEDDIIILKDTVKQRVKRGSNSGHFGHISPMVEIEPYLVKIVTQLANMRMPISAMQGLELANSLIAGTKIELKVKKRKEENCHAYKESVKSESDNSTNNGGTLGISYWRQFLQKKALG
jgi:DNA-binding FrmR family transcriptional regulator